MLAVVSAFGFFGSIVLHELGHAFVAMRHGIGITSIQLWIFGGVARMDRESDSPATEFEVAVAGPLVTLAIVVVLGLVGLAIAAGRASSARRCAARTRRRSPARSPMVAWLASINALVLVFNLLPAFPMDGGRIVRAIAWWRTGDRTPATRFAANLGRVFAYLFIAGGLVLLADSGRVFTGVWLALIGVRDQRLRPWRGDADRRLRPDRGRPRRRRNGPRTGRDPERAQRRAGARRVLPPLPLALVPGGRRRPPLPRPCRPRPRRRGARDLPRELAGLRTGRDDGGTFRVRDDAPLDSLLAQQRPAALRRADGGRRRRPPLAAWSRSSRSAERCATQRPRSSGARPIGAGGAR